MKFVLRYHGSLRSNGSPDHKHYIRQVFHSQLKTLWAQPPLNEAPSLLAPRVQGYYSLLRPLGAFTFAPLITEETSAVAELSLTMLRPEPPGKLITHGGDIDNRLKTLFDALTMPRHLNALPPNAAPAADQAPFYCLFEDDNLITAIAVRTEQLLDPEADKSVVEILINVTTGVTRQTMGNFFVS